MTTVIPLRCFRSGFFWQFLSPALQARAFRSQGAAILLPAAYFKTDYQLRIHCEEKHDEHDNAFCEIRISCSRKSASLRNRARNFRRWLSRRAVSPWRGQATE